MPSNQGRNISQLMDDISSDDLRAATEALQLELRRHPKGSECDCPTMEALAVLYERGYRLIIPRGRIDAAGKYQRAEPRDQAQP